MDGNVDSTAFGFVLVGHLAQVSFSGGLCTLISALACLQPPRSTTPLYPLLSNARLQETFHRFMNQLFVFGLESLGNAFGHLSIVFG